MNVRTLMPLIAGLPKLIVRQILQPMRVALRKPREQPSNQKELAALVESSLLHEIHAGYTHRFIRILFVTAGDRVFCRRYSYSEPSWHSAFRADPAGQIKLDKTIVNIDAEVPDDLADVITDIDRAYARKLSQLGAGFMLAGAVEPRAQASTIELTLAH